MSFSLILNVNFSLSGFCAEKVVLGKPPIGSVLLYWFYAQFVTRHTGAYGEGDGEGDSDS